MNDEYDFIHDWMVNQVLRGIPAKLSTNHEDPQTRKFMAIIAPLFEESINSLPMAWEARKGPEIYRVITIAYGRDCRICQN